MLARRLWTDGVSDVRGVDGGVEDRVGGSLKLVPDVVSNRSGVCCLGG